MKIKRHKKKAKKEKRKTTLNRTIVIKQIYTHLIDMGTDAQILRICNKLFKTKYTVKDDKLIER